MPPSNDTNLPDPSDLPADPEALAGRLLAELELRASPDNVKGMARYGISTAGALGVPVPTVRALAALATKAIERDAALRHELAEALWTSKIHEARIMASLVDDPGSVTVEQMESWVADLDSWDVCDLLVNNLLRRTEAAWSKATEWAVRDEVFVKRAGFVLMATLAVHDKAVADERFVPLLGIVEREACEERNDAKKGVNWALRQIGKRSLPLNAAAIDTAERILATQSECSAARWVARDALRELRSEKVQQRLSATRPAP
jgi:3-methyladenine DNA glycosylase AlkD